MGKLAPEVVENDGNNQDGKIGSYELEETPSLMSRGGVEDVNGRLH